MKALFLCIGLALCQASAAQPRFSNLVFEGAGVRGLAYAGVVKALEEKHLMDSIKRVGGTSAGAIAALMVSLGYSSDDMAELIHNTPVHKFNDGKFLFIGGIARLNKTYGWYRGEAFENWIEEVIEARTGNADITFRELHEKKFKDLSVTGTSLNNQKLIVFSKDTYPEMKVKDAVRISMTIPIYFEAVFIDQQGHILHRKKLPDSYDIVVDGGLTGNFPITIFDPGGQRNMSTLGIRIDSDEQIEYDKKSRGLAPIPITRFKNFVEAFYNYAIENLNRTTLQPDDWQRTVSVSSGNIGPKIKRLSAAEKQELIENGYASTRDFLRQVTENTN